MNQHGVCTFRPAVHEICKLFANYLQILKCVFSFCRNFSTLLVNLLYYNKTIIYFGNFGCRLRILFSNLRLQNAEKESKVFVRSDLSFKQLNVLLVVSQLLNFVLQSRPIDCEKHYVDEWPDEWLAFKFFIASQLIQNLIMLDTIFLTEVIHESFKSNQLKL